MKKRILIIDDDPHTRMLLGLMLEGYDIAEAENGEKGLRAHRENPADLVITDIIMPDKEGIETIRELKQDWPELKIIAVSAGGYAEPKDYLELATLVGADDTIRKPVEPDELIGAVRKLIG